MLVGFCDLGAALREIGGDDLLVPSDLVCGAHGERLAVRQDVATAWNVRTRPLLASRSGFQLVTCSPPSRTRPAVRCTKLETAFMNVVLPAPLGPIKPMI